MVDGTIPREDFRLDVAFPARGGPLPLDHAYMLFGALGHALGDLHGAPWLAVHPLVGSPLGGGLMSLQRSPEVSSLRLRITADRIPDVLRLAGTSLTVGPSTLLLGASRIYPLTPAPALAARMVVIKGYLEPAPFAARVERELAERNLRAVVSVGRRRVVTVHGDKIVGFQLTLRALTPEHSLDLLHRGLGGRQHFGCGIFGPASRSEAQR